MAEAARHRMRVEQVRMVYRQSIPAMLLSMLVAGLVGWILWPVVVHTTLVVWLLAVLLMAISRVTLVFFYWRRPRTDGEAVAWERPFVLSLLLSAAVWGIGGMLLMPADSQLHQSVLYFFLMGMTGGSAAMYSAHLWGSSATITLILLPATLWLFARGQLIPVAMATGGIFYLLSTLRATRLFALSLRRSFQLAHELGHAHAAAETRARTDPLTGLCNRRAFFEQADAMAADASLLMLDIDHFKGINDQYGHAAGDAALRQFADQLRSATPVTGLCARMGGEEFVVLLPGQDRDSAVRWADALRVAVMDAPVQFDGACFDMTVSIGVANRGGLLAQRLKSADAALYRAKHAGRNQVQVDDEATAASSPGNG